MPFPPPLPALVYPVASDITYGPYEIGVPTILREVSASDMVLPTYSVPVAPSVEIIKPDVYSAQADPQVWTKDERSSPLALEDGFAELSFEGDIPGTLELEGDQNYEALTVNSGTPPGVEFMGSRACAVCGQLYKYKDLVFFRGAYYGIPCGDYKDIKGILRKEQDARHVGRSRDEQRSR